MRLCTCDRDNRSRVIERSETGVQPKMIALRFATGGARDELFSVSRFDLLVLSFYFVLDSFSFHYPKMDSLASTGDKTSNQDHLNFINKLNDSKIPRRSQLMANRLFMKNFPREVGQRLGSHRSSDFPHF